MTGRYRPPRSGGENVRDLTAEVDALVLVPVSEETANHRAICGRHK